MKSDGWQHLEDELTKIKKKYNDFEIDIPEKPTKEDVRLNVGGQSFVVGMDTLTSVDGSLLQNFFTAENFKNEKIFIDREPGAFNNMLQYLRSDRKYVPKNLPPDIKAQFEMEIKHWKVDNGLKQYDQLTYSKLQWKIINMLKAAPKIDEHKCQYSSETWRKLKPLTFEEILSNSKVAMDFNIQEYEYGECTEHKDRIEIGQFKKHVGVRPIARKLHGVGRIVYTIGKYDTQIHEGQFVNGLLNGYGRVCYQTGNYYVGQFKNGKKHGVGKSVLKSGKVIQGKHRDNIFVGDGEAAT